MGGQGSGSGRDGFHRRFHLCKNPIASSPQPQNYTILARLVRKKVATLPAMDNAFWPACEPMLLLQM